VGSGQQWNINLATYSCKRVEVSIANVSD
jgi:hypothetical protein